MKQPKLNDWVHVVTLDGIEKGTVTDILATQFIYKLTPDSLPKFCFYTDQWSVKND